MMRADRDARLVLRLSYYAAVAALILATLVAHGHASATKKQAACWSRKHVIRVIVKDVRSEIGTITADLHGEDPEEFLKKGKKIKNPRLLTRISPK